jgi:hypothetical protein
MKKWHEVEMQLREKGKWVKGKAPTFGTMLVHCGAEPTRLLEPEFEYGGQMVSVPAQAADYMAALLLYLTPRSRGRPSKKSTLEARQAMELFGWPQRTAARVIAKYAGEPAEAIRKRLVARSKARPRKNPSRKPGSRRPRSNKPRR